MNAGKKSIATTEFRKTADPPIHKADPKDFQNLPYTGRFFLF